MISRTRPSGSSGLPGHQGRTVALGALLLSGALAQAQVATYNYVRTTGTYTEITGGTSLGTETSPFTSVYAAGTGTPTASNNYYWQVSGPGFPIGFTFQYNGMACDRIGVSSSGWVALGNSANGSTAVNLFTHTNSYYGPLNHSYASTSYASVIPAANRLNYIAGLALTGLMPAGAGTGASLRIETTGSAPNRVCVVQWKDFRRDSWSVPASERISFQIRLYETSNQVEVILKDPATGWQGSTMAAQIGLRGAGATVAPTDYSSLYTPYNSGLGVYDWATLAIAPDNGGVNQAYVGATGVANLPANGTTFRWTPPTCVAPNTVRADFPKSNSLDITWNDSPGAGSYQFAVNTVNSPTTGTPITGTSPGGSVTATGLTSNTLYYVFVRKDCGAGDYSAWSAVAGAPIKTAPACDEAFNHATTFTGTPYAQNWTICGDAGEVSTVTFSTFNVVTGSYPTALYVYNGPTTASAQISSGLPGQSGVATAPGGFHGTAIPGPFTSSDPSGCLTFRYVSTYGGQDWTSAVTCMPAPTCFPPTGVSVVRNPQGGTISWTGTASNYEYKIVADGALSSAPALVSGFDNASPVVVMDNALAANTPYRVFMRSICAPGDTSGWSFPTNFRTAVGCGGPFDGYRSGFTSYPVNMDSVTVICPNNPGDQVTLQFDYFSYGQSGDDAMYVYDGPNTSSALLGSSLPATSSGFPAGGYYGNWTAPGNVNFPGPFTSTHSGGCLTVRFRSNASQGSFYDTGWESNVTCAPAPPCATPSAVTVTNIGGTQATINWVGAGSNYIIEYGPAGFTPGTGATAGSGSSFVVSGVTSGHTIMGLSATTAYKVVVRQVCAGPTYSANSFPANFGTSMDCSTAVVLACGELRTETVVSGVSGNALYNSTYYSAAPCMAPIQGQGVEKLFRITAPMAGTYQVNLVTPLTSSQLGFMTTPVSNGCGAGAFTCIGVSTTGASWPYAPVAGAFNFNLTAGDHYIMMDPALYAAGSPQFQVLCPGIPPCVIAPTFPSNNASLAVNSTPIAFSWPAAFGATGYDIYFNDALVVSNHPSTSITSSSYTPAALAATYGIGTDITWRVQPRNSYGTASCTNWTFRVGGNGPVNAIPLTNGVAMGGSTRTANGYSNQNGQLWGNDTHFSFVATDCATHVNLQLCPYAGVNSSNDYVGLYLIRASDNQLVAPFNGGYAGTTNGCMNSNNLAVSPGQTYYVVADGYAWQYDFTIKYTEVVNTTDTDGDGLADCEDSCVELPGQVGDPCDLGPYVLNAAINEDCVCAGDPMPCATDLVIEFTVGANGTLPNWELRGVGNNIVLQSGTGFPMPPGTVFPVSTCLPEGSFYLRVTGAMGTGGGYVLRTSGNPGTRIIDNRNNYVSGATSQVATGDGIQIPMGTNKVIYTSCDKYFWKTNEYIVAEEDAQVTAQWGITNATSGYEFWIFNPNGGYSFRKFRTHADPDGFAPANGVRACHMKINNWAAANHVPQNTLMNVRVRARVNGVNKAWGPACRFVRNDALANCPPTKLMDVPGNPYISCGATKAFNNLTANRVHARPISGATAYQFRFSLPGEGGVVTTRQNSTYYINLGWLPSTGTVLQDGITYDVDVRAMVNGVWCAWGEICKLTICNTPPCAGAAQGGNQTSLMETNGAFSMWPNPNRGDQLFLSLSAVEEGVSTINVDLFDMAGKRVIARTLAVNEGTVSGTLELHGDIAPGMYMVHITAGSAVHTERLVIQP